MQTGVAILWIGAAGFLSGIFVRSYLPLGMPESMFLLLLAVAVVLLSLGHAHIFVRALLGAVFVGSIVAGAVRMDSARIVPSPYLDAQVGHEVVLEGVVYQEPDVREGSTHLAVAIERAASSSESVSTNVLATLSPYSRVAYGDAVRVVGAVKIPERFGTVAGREFDYPGYLAVSGIGYQLQRAHAEVLEPAGVSFTGTAIALKQLYLHGIAQALPEPQAGLAGGITAGDKRGLGGDLSESFRIVSLVHVIVLSGYNITVVAAALARVLGKVSAPRSVLFGSGGFVAIFFAVMTGGAAASVRAAVMALIAITAGYSGRIYRADRALAVAALGMAAWDPFVVAFDPGFQLSIIATAGLIWLSPLVESWYGRVPERFGLREVAVSTTSAQLAVLPLLLYQGGLLSFVALPANLLVLAAVPLAMFWSLVAGVAGLVLGPAAPLFALPAYLLLTYMIEIAQLLAHLPLAAVEIPAFSGVLLIPVYAVLFGYALFRLQKTTAANAAVVGNDAMKG